MGILRVVISLILAAIASSAANGVDVDLNLGGSLQYESNVFRSTDDPQPDFGIRLSPVVRVSDSDDRYRYDVGYRADFEKFVEHPTADDVNHYVNSSFERMLTSRLQAFGSDSFRLTNSVTSELISDDPSTDDIDETGRRDSRRQNLQNDVVFGLKYDINSRVRSSITMGHQYFDPENINGVAVNTVYGRAEATYRSGKKARIGGGGSATLQFFGDRIGAAASRSGIYEIFGIVNYKFTSDTNLALRGGPTIIRSSQKDARQSYPNQPVYPATNLGGGVIAFPDVTTPALEAACVGSTLVADQNVYVPRNCPIGVPFFPGNDTTYAINAANAEGQTLAFGQYQDAPLGASDSTLTFFTSASISHRWSDNLRSSIHYRRSQGDTPGIGGTAIRDRVTFRTNWNPTEKLEVAFRVSWRNRKLASERNQAFVVIETENLFGVNVVKFTDDLVSTTIDDAVDQKQWTVNLRAFRRMTRKLTGTLEFTYYWAENTRSRAASDNFRVNLGVRYDFDRIRVWH